MSDDEIDSIVTLGYILKSILETSDDPHNGVYVSLDDGFLTLDGRIKLNSVQTQIVQYTLPKV